MHCFDTRCCWCTFFDAPVSFHQPHGVAPEHQVFSTPSRQITTEGLPLIMDRMTDSGRLMTGFNAI